MERVSLAIVTSRPEDFVELKQILDQTPWDLETISQIEDVVPVLKAAPVPILLLDREAAGEQWQTPVKRLLKSRRSAAIILLSSVADQYLWDEVVHQGGFDLLPRPFRKEQVLTTLLFAYAHCNAPWPKAAS